MGTDIHGQIEYRKRGETEWHWLLEDIYIRYTEKGGAPLNVDFNGLNPFPRDRNYEWFGMLAGVRNEDVEQFPQFRRYDDDLDGMALEVSPWLRHALLVTGTVDLGYHDFGIIYLDQLKTWWESVKDKPQPMEGYVSMDEYAELRKTGKPPRSYSGGVGGSRVVCIESGVADAMLDGLIEPEAGKDYYVRMHWFETYKELLSFSSQGIMDGWFVLWLIDQDKDKSGNYEFRYVIGFDS